MYGQVVAKFQAFTERKGGLKPTFHPMSVGILWMKVAHTWPLWPSVNWSKSFPLYCANEIGAIIHLCTTKLGTC